MEPEKEADRASSYLTNGITDFIGGCAAALVNSFDISCLYRAFCRPTYTYITVLRVLSPLVGSDRSIKYQGQELSKVRYIPEVWKVGQRLCHAAVCMVCMGQINLLQNFITRHRWCHVQAYKDMLLATEENKIKRWESCIDRYINIFTQLCDINVA